MSDATVTRIPIPSVILKGDWYGIVYAIDTEGKTLEEHNSIVEEDIQRYCTLSQLRIRDSY